ncbi:hypothetical protein C7271_07510 [filamentous cyanobacterium CCP5]|nr:hypothetical protein C7271_07510 [filamentous cyanobacterium CCP5]
MIESFLLKAALLAGYGRSAAPLAQKLAAIAQPGGDRSCLDAGSPVQLTVAAPGPPELRVGLRLANLPEASQLQELISPRILGHLTPLLTQLPRSNHPSMGTWLFWSETQLSFYIDLRDPNPADALRRLQPLLTLQQQETLRQVAIPSYQGRPWVARIDASLSGISRLHVHWLIHRQTSAQVVAETLAPGQWPRVVKLLGYLLKRPTHSGRWVVATPLDGQSNCGLYIGNSGWALVPEDMHKHRQISRLFKQLGGPQDYAEALWSLCRGNADLKWRVGRACELQVNGDEAYVQLFFVPQLQPT